MASVKTNYGVVKPSDYTFITGATPHKGYFGYLAGANKELTVCTATSQLPFCMFLDDHDAVQNDERKITIAIGTFEVQTDVFTAPVTAYVPGALVYLDATGIITATAGSNKVLGIITATSTTEVTAFLKLPVLS